MRIDIADLTDRIRDLIDYYTVKDADGELLVDLDSWNSDDLREMISLLTAVMRERGEDNSFEDIYDYTFEDWVEKQIDQELADQMLEESWDEYVREARKW